MANFGPSGSGGLPLEITTVGISNPQVSNIDLLLAGVEYSYPLPAGTRKWMLQLRDSQATLQLGFTPGSSATEYLTVARGCALSEEGIEPSATLTIYLQTSLPMQVLEILSWT